MAARRTVDWIWPVSLLWIAILPLQSEELNYAYGANFQLIRPLSVPRNEDYLEKGQSALRSSLSWVNVWSIQDERFLIDGEEIQLGGSYRYALSDRWQLGLHFSFVSQGGGSFDNQIEAFHDASRVGQSQRTRYQQNTFNVSYEPYGPIYPLFDRTFGESYYRRLLPRRYPHVSNDESLPFDIDDRLLWLNQGRLADVLEVPAAGGERSGWGDPRLFTQVVLWQGNGFWRSLHLGLEAKIPAHGGELIGAPGLDATASLAARQQWNRQIKTWVGTSLTHFGEIHYRFFKLPRYQWTWRTGLDFEQDADLTLFAEYLYFSPPTHNFGELSRPGHQIALGGRLKMDQNYRLQFAVIENFLNYGVTPDIGLFFSGEYQLR
ncbi:MAG: DUF3187 family protein [Leptospiraceae bacterium]|nr:DUF3187 family protein [Leptospiraceae bacterium]